MQRVRAVQRRLGMDGFALIEWLLALAIASSLVAAAVGPWRRWWVGLALSRTEHAMLMSLAIARHAAQHHNRPIEVCRADAHGACAPKTMRDATGRDVAPSEWPYGWLVVVDRPQRVRQDTGRSMMRQGAETMHGMIGAYGNRQFGNHHTVLHRVDAIHGVRVSSSMSNGRLVFRPPLGLTVGRWGQILIAPDIAPTEWSALRDGPLAVRCVVLGGAGRARVVRGDCR